MDFRPGDAVRLAHGNQVVTVEGDDDGEAMLASLSFGGGATTVKCSWHTKSGTLKRDRFDVASLVRA